MAQYGPDVFKIEYDNAAAALVDITAYVLTINDIDVEEITEEVRPFGAAWDTHLAIGVGRVPVVELSGVFDDIVTVGPDALFANRLPEGPAIATRSLKLTWGSTKTTTFETLLLTYRRSADKNGLTKYTARLQPTGAVTEA